MGRQSFGSGRSDGADFVAEGIHVGRDERLLPGVGVEVAVGAAVEAKGDVEVEGVHEDGREVRSEKREVKRKV
jgi:hypothetical protein